MAFSTRSRAPALTEALPLRTRETVPSDVPECSATSLTLTDLCF